ERLGALLADRVRDEGGVTYAPGTIVGSDAVIAAGASVRGTIGGETEVQ
ncbi:nucleotidyl transferase, partial [Natrinema soli]